MASGADELELQQGLGAVGRLLDQVSLVLQDLGDDLPNGALVVNDQDASGMHPSSWLRAHAAGRLPTVSGRAGENVAAGEVEAVLKEHPAVFDAAVIGVPDPMRDEAIKAYVVLREGSTATAEELIGWCAQRLAKFRVPEFIEFRRDLPRTSVGKIQKHLLRAEHGQATPG